MALYGNTEITVKSTEDRAVGILALGSASPYVATAGDNEFESDWESEEDQIQKNQMAYGFVSNGNLTINVST